jgi:hypothetical protein
LFLVAHEGNGEVSDEEVVSLYSISSKCFLKVDSSDNTLEGDCCSILALVTSNGDPSAAGQQVFFQVVRNN